MARSSRGYRTEMTTNNILRTVPDENGFYFYQGVDSPLGLRANSLEQFSEELQTVDPRSIRFHLGRQDFENWISMLGDATLARQISTLRTKKLSDAELKMQLISMVRMRLGQLRRA
jgi:hypothetical protein